MRHESGVDLRCLAPPSPDAADHVSAERHHLLQIVEVLRTRYDYVVVDLDQRLDDHALDVLGVADHILVVMNADLSCIKNVRLVMETMEQVGVPAERLSLLMNRSNAMTGVCAKSVEAVLKRAIEFLVVNDYRVAITALNTGQPFMLSRARGASGRRSRTWRASSTVQGPRRRAALGPGRVCGCRQRWARRICGWRATRGVQPDVDGCGRKSIASIGNRAVQGHRSPGPWTMASGSC